jgi:hypothetical protein
MYEFSIFIICHPASREHKLNSIHAKNEHCYIINDKPSILDQLHVDVPFKKR